MSKLTDKKNWHVAAGGTSAAPDKYSYSAYTSIGEYHVWPLASNGRHVGYVARFANNKGKLPGGLWMLVARGCNLATGLRLCHQHMIDNGGELLARVTNTP